MSYRIASRSQQITTSPSSSASAACDISLVSHAVEQTGLDDFANFPGKLGCPE